MNRLTLCAAAAALGALAPVSALAQETAPADRLQQLENKIDLLDLHYQQELKKRDEQISQLREELRIAREGPTPLDIARLRAQRDITEDILRDIETRKKEEPLQRVAAIANPDIAAVVDFVGLASSKNIDGTRNRFDVREAELDLRASVDPRADAVLVLAFARDAFPALWEASDEGGPETNAEVEEGYLTLHDFGVPNLQARLGRYHVRFGRQNVLHAHDLPTTDTPFVLQSFLAPEALVDSGLELSYVVPNPWNEYIEIITEINAGEGAGAESPTLTGDDRAQSPSVVMHALWNKNLTPFINLELGGSTLWGPSENHEPHPSGGSRDVWLYGADATLVFRDPSGGFNNQLLQAEAIYGHTRQNDYSMANAWGAYLLAQQQLAKDWFTGVRLDYTQNANDNDQTIWGTTAYLTWYWSEFLRFRVSYEHRGYLDVALPEEDLFMFQATWIFGAHPPHPYWAMK